MRKKILVIGAVGLITLVLVFAYFSGDSEAPTSPNASTSENSSIIFDESSLLNRGVTSEQLTNLEQVLGRYFDSQEKSPRRVDFNTIYRVPPDPKNSKPFTELTFVVQPDGRPTYKAKMDAFGSSEIRLYLYTLDGNTLLYDSQNIGGASN